MKWTTNFFQITNVNSRNLPIFRKTITTFFLAFCFLISFAQHSIAYLRTIPKTESFYHLSGRTEQTIPFELVRGMIVIQAQIDQQPGQFILDTGAPLMIINDQPEAPSRWAASFKKEIQVGETTIEAFNWAGIEEKSLDALVLDISHLESAFDRTLKGMIGFNVLKEYELFFDYEQQFILRYPPRKNFLHKNVRPLLSIPFKLYDHLPVITVEIGKKKFTFGLDTGACTNMIDQSVLEALEAEWFSSLPQEEVQGLDQDINRVPVIALKEIRVKELVLNDLKFLAADMPQLHSDAGIALDGLLGYSFLSQMKFSINYPKQQIYVWEQLVDNQINN